MSEIARGIAIDLWGVHTELRQIEGKVDAALADVRSVLEALRVDKPKLPKPCWCQTWWVSDRKPHADVCERALALWEKLAIEEETS